MVERLWVGQGHTGVAGVHAALVEFVDAADEGSEARFVGCPTS